MPIFLSTLYSDNLLVIYILCIFHIYNGRRFFFWYNYELIHPPFDLTDNLIDKSFVIFNPVFVHNSSVQKLFIFFFSLSLSLLIYLLKSGFIFMYKMFKIPKRDNIGLRDVKGKFTMKVLTFKKKLLFMCVTRKRTSQNLDFVITACRICSTLHQEQIG